MNFGIDEDFVSTLNISLISKERKAVNTPEGMAAAKAELQPASFNSEDLDIPTFLRKRARR